MVANTSVPVVARVMADAECVLGDAADDALREWLVREAVLDVWVSQRTITLSAAEAAVRQGHDAGAAQPAAIAQPLAA